MTQINIMATTTSKQADPHPVKTTYGQVDFYPLASTAQLHWDAGSRKKIAECRQHWLGTMNLSRAHTVRTRPFNLLIGFVARLHINAIEGRHQQRRLPLLLTFAVFISASCR